MRSLDGLRGVAVLAVMLFHTASSPLSGGFLGVDVFFTLSGFLIAGILVRQWDQNGMIVLSVFWLRRARRLAPALLLLLTALATARLAIPQLDSSAWRMDILAALTYTTNWFQIVSGGDYFAQFGMRSPLMHTWSLAIEEQFYVLFAILIFVLVARLSRTRLVVVLCALAITSAIWMAWLGSHNPTWAYYGTWSRVQALLIGAALGILVQSWASIPARLRVAGRFLSF
ncbi:MAG: acyltransferase, partial [Actinobacteria bacterium]|nr:acyltransferase [Actinomycetota bacterium]